MQEGVYGYCGQGGEIHYSARPMPTPDGLISWSLLRATFFWTIRLETETEASGFDTSACVWLETHGIGSGEHRKPIFFIIYLFFISIYLSFCFFIYWTQFIFYDIFIEFQKKILTWSYAAHTPPVVQ